MVANDPAARDTSSPFFALSWNQEVHSFSCFCYYTSYPKSCGKNLLPLNTVDFEYEIFSYLYFFVYYFLKNIFKEYDRAFCQCIYHLFFFPMNLSFFEGATFSKVMAIDNAQKPW